MKRFRTMLAIAAVLLFCLAGTAAAQFANADLAGKVTSADGSPLPGVTVTITNQETGATRTVVTTANGSYFANGLRPARYTIRFELDGFKAHERTDVQLLVGQTSRVNATLEIGAVAETITVTSSAPLIEVDSKEVGGTITDEEFAVLPSANRSALLFAALLPGVIPSPDTQSTSSDSLFINGQTDFNNSFNIDGANNDDDVIGAIAGAQTRTSIEAIQEFQVLTSQFDAEFGRALGGVLNAVTKSGSNQFKGSAWAYRQDSSLNESDFFVKVNNLEEPDTEYENFGFNLGGPIIRDKFHFFINYEDITDAEGIARSFAARPEFNFSTSEDNTLENTMGRLDYQLGESHHFAGRFVREESPQFNQIVSSRDTLQTSREEDDTDNNWIVTYDAVTGANSLNVARISFTKEDVAFANPGFNNNGQNFSAQRNQPPLEDRPGIRLGASDVAQSRVNRSTQFDDTYSFVIPDWGGEHSFRVGFNYSNREEEFNNFGDANGDFDFDTDRPWDRNDLSTYPTDFTIRVGGPLTGNIPDNEVKGVFAQDDWQVTPDLTLNLGMRYDDESVTDETNFSPRVGFAWDIGGKGKTVLRGGIGRFYDRLPLFLWDNFTLDAVSLTSGFTTSLPSAGEDKQLFFDIVQANGITSLTELRDFLANMIEGSATALLNTSPTVDNKNREQPYLDSFTIGVQRELIPGLALTVDLVRAENNKALIAANLNPFSSALGGRPNISILNGEVTRFNSIFTYVNEGEREYNALQILLDRRFDGRWGGRLAITSSDGEGNYDGDPADLAFFQTRTETGFNFDTGEIIGEPLQLNLDDPRNKDQNALFDRDLNIVVSGQYRVPHTSWRENGGLVVSGVWRYLDGDHFTIFDQSARLDNGNRIPAPEGTYQPTDSRGRARRDVSSDGKLNGAELPNFAQLDLSFRYNLPVHTRYTVGIVADIFNVTDHVNFANVASSRVGTSAFLVPTAVRSPQSFQLAIRFDF